MQRSLAYVYENRAAFTALASLIATAFLVTSPEPGVRWTVAVVYAWFRSALLLIFNTRHPLPSAVGVDATGPKLVTP